MERDAEGLFRVLVDALNLLPDSELIERDDWIQLRTPSSSYTNHNKVMRARLHRGEADRVIEEVKRDHAERGAGLAWVVDATSSPSDLSGRVARAGIAWRGTMVGMVRDAKGPRRPVPAWLEMRRATIADVPVLADVAVKAWERTATFGQAVRAWASRALADPDTNVGIWLAYVDGEPIGSATVRILASGVGYLMGACVMRSHRGRGIYTALTEVRMDAIVHKGLDTVVIWANPETSWPVAVKLGFDEVTRGNYHDLEASELKALA